MDIRDAMNLVEQHEGRKNRVYKDTRGIDTIGVGFNLEAQGAQQIVESLGINYAKLRSGQIALTESQIDQLFAHSFANAVQVAKRFIPCFDEIPAPGQVALVDLAFDLDHKLGDFHKMIRFLEAEQYMAAGAELVNSALFHEIPHRVIDDRRLIEQCKPEPEVVSETAQTN